MSEEFVNKVTLEYLVNKEYNITHKTSNKVNKKDKKFYRKRIFNLTKELLSNEEPPNLSPDVKHAFDNYVNHCIHYFKVIDCSDILQEDYKDITGFDFGETDCDESIQQTQDEANKLMMRSINIQSTTLDKFIKRTVKKDTTIMPQQKDVDLSNPDLKLKGVKKKKNITNTYEDTKEIPQETPKKDNEQTKNENKDGGKDGAKDGAKNGTKDGAKDGESKDEGSNKSSTQKH